VKRKITVRGQSNLPPQNALATPIISPPTPDVTINAGEQVYFAAMDIPASAGQQVLYNWSFSDGVNRDINRAVAGSIQYTRPGRYTATLRLRLVDAFGNNLSESRFVVNINVSGSFAGGGGAGAFGNGRIRLPDRDVVIQAGNAVSFDGDSLDPSRFTNTNYLWQFNQVSGSRGNRIRDINRPNAGQVAFDTEGEFEARFSVDGVDQLTGAPVAFSESRRILVLPPNGGGLPPISGIPTLRARIEAPNRQQNIRVGQSIDFAGSVSGASPNARIRFDWDFGGSAPNTRAQVPGRVTFSRVGDFDVRLRVQDSDGGFDPNPPSVRVRVDP
jgi:hypothetical protein